MINYKETRMDKDGEDSHGLQTLQDVQTMTCCFN